MFIRNVCFASDATSIVNAQFFAKFGEAAGIYGIKNQILSKTNLVKHLVYAGVYLEFSVSIILSIY